MQTAAINSSLDEHGPQMVERFTTEAVKPNERLRYWNDLTNNTFTGLTIDSMATGPFRASLERLTLRDVGVAVATAEASSITHHREHVARSVGGPQYLLHLQLTGLSINEQAGREAHLEPGDFAICDTTRPYRLRFDDEATFLVLRMSAARLQRRLPGIDDAVAMRVPASPSRSRLLRSMITMIREAADDLTSGEAQCDAADVIVDLAVLCLREACTAPEYRPLDMNARFFTLADAHFTDADFGVGDIARALGVSTRCVQKAFAARGTTSSAYILRRRLAAAARELVSGDDPVTEVAFGCGFNDLSYFTRAFRRQYGISPRQFRQSAG